MSRLTPAQLDDLKAHNSCEQWARRWVRLRRHGVKWIGPCPLHSPDPQANDSTSFECDAASWVCAVCSKGGDVIALVMEKEALDFNRAIELLGGAAPLPADAEDVKRAQAAAAEKRAQREAESNAYRARERARAKALAHYGQPLAGSAGERYLREARGVDFPPDVRLRCDPKAHYYVPDHPKARLIHTGPALLAVIERGGKFIGLHSTFIDLARPKGKAHIVDPKGDGTPLDVKKMRGSKKGGHIELVPAPSSSLKGEARLADEVRDGPDKKAVEDPHTLVIGEGTEKVLAVWTAFKQGGRELAGIAWWSAGDLGNLGGKAAASVPHPFLKTDKGRALRVAGPAPDLTAPAIEIPAGVTRVIILGDSTSDRFSTQCAIARAAVRWARPGLEILAAWSPDGKDFDDLLREAA